MSFKDRLKEAVTMSALGATLVAPGAPTQGEQTIEAPQPAVTRPVTPGWTWGTDAASLSDKAIYESLPAEYKAFAGKGFMDRMEMREEWEQRHFMELDRKRSAILKRNPNATLRDFAPDAMYPDDKLADYPVAEGSYGTKLISEEVSGKLTPAQARLAREMVSLGRPLATIDPNLPYSEQLKACGFDLASEVASGRSLLSLNARDRSLYIAQDQDADILNNRNEEARRALRIRFMKEEDEAWDKANPFWKRLFRTKTTLLPPDQSMLKWEKINGKDVSVRHPNEITYSIHDEVTRRVADKIERDDKATQAQQMRRSTQSR